MENISKKKFYGLLIFSLILLFNANINLIDILPDFIAYFILAKLFERAADSAAYFEEARAGFLKLAWLNLAKIPAFILILMIRGGNAADNDVFALFSISFGVIEALFAVNAAKNIFSALFHLGERTSASATISPLEAPIFKKRSLTPQAVKEYTYFFIICKCIIYWLPDMFLLTRVTDSGHILTISKYYPYVLIIAQLLGTFVGIIWLLRIKKYAKAIYTEGEFTNALSALASEDTSVKFTTKVKLRSINSILTFMAFASFLSLELVFDDFNKINIMPHFLFGILMICVFYWMQKHSEKNKLAFAFGGVYILFSIVAYTLSVRFYNNFEYMELIENRTAQRAYTLIQIFSVFEFAALILFLFFAAKIYKSFIIKNTGLDIESERYNERDAEYHRGFVKRAYIHFGILGLVSLTQCLNVFFKRYVKYIFSDRTDVTMPVIYTSFAPWFNIVVTAVSVLYIAYTLYITSKIKEEAEMKYSL